MTAVQEQPAEAQTNSVKDAQNPSNGGVADKTGGYDVGALATSSLMGLVATVKEHITKPTAMAQGRVAHLIEWKGWGGGGGGDAAGGWSSAWGKGGGGWGGMGADLQEDEQFYSQMTDEIKEARFAAGVAEQFALAEAAMSVWSMDDCVDEPTTSVQAAPSHFLSQFLLDAAGLGVPQHLYDLHCQAYGAAGGSRMAAQAAPQPVVDSVSPSQQDAAATATKGAVRHVDSSSLSEDDVFYN